MLEPIRISLPNGLTLEMFPRLARRQGFKTLESAETQAELWRRFVGALKSTDFDAIVKLYTSAVAQTERPALPKAQKPVGTLLLEEKREVKP